MEKWEGKVAVVTGASAGIGRAIVVRLAQHGVSVAALARRFEKLEELRNEVGNGKILPVKCDVTDVQSVQNAFKKVFNELGQVSILVNAAGIILGTKFSDFELDKWNKMFSVNVFGVLCCTKQMFKAYMDSGSQELAQIININSIAGQTVFDNVDFCPYAASKHSLKYFTDIMVKLMAQEKINIRVTSIHPGVVKTDLFETGDFYRELFRSAVSLQANDVADTVVNALSAPPNTLVSSMTIKPMGELF